MKVCSQTTTMSIYKGSSRKKYVNKYIDKKNVFFKKGNNPGPTAGAVQFMTLDLMLQIQSHVNHIQQANTAFLITPFPEMTVVANLWPAVLFIGNLFIILT